MFCFNNQVLILFRLVNCCYTFVLAIIRCQVQNNATMNVTILCMNSLYREILDHWATRIPGIQVLGTVSTVEEFCNLRMAQDTDVLILGLHSKNPSDLSFIKRISNEYVDIKILVVSMFNDQKFQILLKEMGADGFIEKYSIGSELAPAIQKINNGEVHFCTRLDKCKA